MTPRLLLKKWVETAPKCGRQGQKQGRAGEPDCLGHVMFKVPLRYQRVSTKEAVGYMGLELRRGKG